MNGGMENRIVGLVASIAVSMAMRASAVEERGEYVCLERLARILADPTCSPLSLTIVDKVVPLP